MKTAWTAFAAVCATCSFGGELVLAQRGRPAECAIILSASAGESCRYAARELRDYVRRMTGVELPIREEGESPSALPRNSVFIREEGSSPDGEDAFHLKSDGTNLRISGGRRGVLYGVYELLETYGGVGWFASWRTVVPARDRFAVPDTLDDAQKPAFALRTTTWYDVTNEPAFAARLRLNGERNIPDGDAGARFGGTPYRFGRTLRICHTFTALLPSKKHFREHPEWFSEVDGCRKSAPTQLCLTNPEVLRNVTSNVLDNIRRDPGRKFYGVSQDDNGYFCACTNCAAVDATEGSHAGTLLRFVNAVAEEVEKEFPDVVIETLAYVYSRKPPKITKPRRNVAPCLCSIECDVTKPLGAAVDIVNTALRPDFKDWGTRINREFESDIRGWGAATRNLFVWDYATNFRDYPQLLPNVHTLASNLRFFRDNGVRFMLEQGDVQGLHADFAELKAWLIAKLMWNPNQALEPLLDRFFEGYYGAAAPFARRYFDKAQALGRASGLTGRWWIYSSTDLPDVSDGFLAEATNLWAQATAAVKGDPVLSYNVRMGAMSPLYTIAARSPAGWLVWASRDASRYDAEGTRRIVAELEECQRLSGGRIRWAETPWQNSIRLAGWRRFMSRNAMPRMDGTAVLDADLLAEFVAKGKGAVVADASAMGGKALRLLPNGIDRRAIRIESERIAYDAGAKYRVRVHVRVAKKPGGRGEVFCTKIEDNPRHTGYAKRSFSDRDVGDEYRWHEIIDDWQIGPDQQFFIGQGRFDQGKHSTSPVHDGIYFDALEISRCD